MAALSKFDFIKSFIIANPEMGPKDLAEKIETSLGENRPEWLGAKIDAQAVSNVKSAMKRQLDPKCGKGSKDVSNVQVKEVQFSPLKFLKSLVGRITVQEYKIIKELDFSSADFETVCRLVK